MVCRSGVRLSFLFVCWKPWLCVLRGYCLSHARASFSPHRWLFYTGRNSSSETCPSLCNWLACVGPGTWFESVRLLRPSLFPNCNHWLWIIDLIIFSTQNITFYVSKMFRIGTYDWSTAKFKTVHIFPLPCTISFVLFVLFCFSEYWYIVQAGPELTLIPSLSPKW